MTAIAHPTAIGRTLAMECAKKIARTRHATLTIRTASVTMLTCALIPKLVMVSVSQTVKLKLVD